MAYQRFLNDKDYLALITQEGLDQLIREVHDRIPQAESSAEVSVLEYLRQYYEVEEELAKGKAIKPYYERITYPAGVYFLKDGYIYRTLTAINGYKRPNRITYWVLVEESLTSDQLSAIQNYSQLKTYNVGEYVRYGNDIWKCNYQNGFDFDDIRIPGMYVWEQVVTTEWVTAAEYDVYQVASYGGKFYMLLNKDEGYDPLVNPVESNNWGEIGAYNTDYEYAYGVDDHDYVVFDGCVFKPVMNPNADKLNDNSNNGGVNIVRDDPRNPSLVKHMTQLALYQLHVLISPTNISETRRIQYEDSMAWLYAASKFKIIIDIKRKINKEDGLPRKDYALATYQKDFDPWQNDWII